ncbi:tyrosine-type recombinase/integrase [Listeria rocourtiae]|uniref:tyrosine-type recombinase/integrase n=1 Tax=Listeria rocourtiae TaxID=647910 RepID=UPI0034D956AC
MKDHNQIEVSLLFANANGTPFNPKTINQFWNRYIENHGFKKITIHEMRHTAATYLTESIDMKTLQSS